jgi:sodium transport system ATP-binding protein
MIRVEGVSKRFLKGNSGKTGGSRTLDAVDGVSFSCEPGRIFSLLGPNGAGKTTMLRMIATILRPTSGSISVAGFDTVRESGRVRERIGFLTGSTGLYERLTPAELVDYYGRLHGVEKGRLEQRKKQLFESLGISGFADRRIGRLSSGMKQRVSIARTIIHDPDVVVFDEPTTGLDVITAKSIIDLIRECRNSGKTVIFSTHIMGEVSLLSDDLAVIDRGRLLYCGTFDDFIAESTSRSLEDRFIKLVEKAGA